MSVTMDEGAALPRTCRDALDSAAVWCWPAGAVYSGPPLGLDRHSGAVACLAVAVDGTLAVQVDHQEVLRHQRTLFIPARLPHQLSVDAARVVFTYIDPGSDGHRAVHGATHEPDGSVRTGHDRESELVAAAALLGPESPAGTLRRFLDVAAPLAASDRDELVAAVLPVLRAGAADHGLSAAAVAAEVQLSTSRFLRRFRAATGTSYRRYRAWTRLLAAAAAVGDGADLTAAAHEAGFASSAHLSTTFRRTFGLAPSQLLTAGVTVVALDTDPRQAAR